MKKTLPLLVILLLSMTGCIDIVEEITIYGNNAGKITIKFETSQFASVINNFTGFLNNSTDNQLIDKTREIAGKLEKCKGIDSVRFLRNDKMSNTLLEFSFTGAEELNNAVYNLFGYKKTIFSPTYLKATDHQFKRINFSPLVKKYIESENVEIPAKDLLDLINFKTVIHHAREVKRCQGSNIRLHSNGKVLVQTNNLKKVLENKADVSIKCRLRKY